MMAYPARVAHAAGRYDDKEAREPVDCLALFGSLGETNVARIECLEQHCAALYLFGMALKNSAGASGKW